MEILKPQIDTDFTSTALHEALIKMKSVVGGDCELQARLVISKVYMHQYILECIFNARGKLDIPFEVSYALPVDAWMLVEDSDKAIFYSPGA